MGIGQLLEGATLSIQADIKNPKTMDLTLANEALCQREILFPFPEQIQLWFMMPALRGNAIRTGTKGPDI